MKHMKILIIMAMALAATHCAWAVKAHPRPFSVRQGDGTTITVKAHGDEHFHYYTASDGTILVKEGTGLYVATLTDEGEMASTGIMAHEPSQRTLTELMAIKRQDRKAITRLGARVMESQRAKIAQPSTDDSQLLFPHQGSPHALVIMVEFNDLGFSIDNPKEAFDKNLNADEVWEGQQPEYTNYGSVKRYFSDMSNGQFKPQFDIYGPYKLNQSYTTYGRGNDNIPALMKDACQAANDDVDFSKYDLNNDGYVDLVFIVHAGYGEHYYGNSSNYIWAQSGLTTSIDIDGKKVRRYGVTCELFGYEEDEAEMGKVPDGIGLFCHEFCHCLGLPDIYPTGASENSECSNVGLGYYGLMDSGEYTFDGFRPTALTCWERARLGWMEIEQLDSPQDITLTTAERGGKAYMITNEANPNEYYMLEQVEKADDLWNRYILGQGMMIYHIDFDETKFKVSGIGYNCVNCELGHPRFSLVPADGLMVNDLQIGYTVTRNKKEEINEINKVLLERYENQKMTGSIYTAEAKGDPFPGTSEATAFTDDTMPAATWFTGGTAGKPITDIHTDDNGNVAFKFMGGSTSVATPEATQTMSSPYYTLDGRKAGNDTKALKKGIYVRKGKKVAVNTPSDQIF